VALKTNHKMLTQKHEELLEKIKGLQEENTRLKKRKK